MDNQIPPPPPPPDFSAAPMPGDPAEARRALMIPGIGLAISAGVGIIMIFLNMLQSTDPGQQARDLLELMQQFGLLDAYRDAGIPMDETTLEETMMMGQKFQWPLVFLQLVGSSLLLASGVLMVRLRSWNLAVAGSIVALIPCLYNCCCCVTNIPLGIWALILLVRSDIKNAFR